MTRISSLALLAALCLAQRSCSDDDGPGQFRYPLKDGAQWYYTREPTAIRDSASYVMYSFTTVVSVGDLRSFWPNDTARAFDIAQFLQNRAEGLYSIANCGTPPFATPKRSAFSFLDDATISALAFADVIAHVSCDSFPIEGAHDRPLVLPYPIRIGQDWQYRLVEELGWEIRKVIRGWSDLRVDAGQFKAYQIQWYHIGGPRNVEITDDIAAHGLVRRTLVIDSAEVRDLTHPEGTGEYKTWVEVLALDSLKL